jgi:serine/threonine protein kinase
VKLVKDGEGNRFAMKIMKSDSKKSKEQEDNVFMNEVEVMKDLDHPHLLKLIDYNTKAEALRPDGTKLKLKYLTLEYAEAGELFDYIAETGVFPESHARYFYHQLISALEHMHSKGYKHRDLKPENILFDKDFNLKLADFGFATTEDISDSRKGTYGYMAPEVIANNAYRGEEADLFASAVLLFILVTQHPPFIRAEEDDRYYSKVFKGQWNKFWDVHSDMDISENFIDLFTKMVSIDPKDRLTLEQVKAHPWFNGPLPTPEEIKEDFLKRQKVLKNVLKRKGKENENTENAQKPKPAKKKKIPMKYTKFYEVEDADLMVDTVVKCAQHLGIKYDKSKEYFRVELKAQKDKSEVHMLVNILKKPENNMRCLEFVKISGDLADFESVFKKFRSYCGRKFE